VISRLEKTPSQCARMLTLAVACAGALALILSGCDSGSSSSKTSSTDPNHPALALLSWCDHPSIEFQDDSTTQQTVITDWTKVKDQLGFTPYLPATLPKGSCLVLAGGTVHDPIYGARLSMTYDLPNSVPLSFSEAPKRANLGGALQCQASATDTTTSICIGSITDTTITIAARESQGEVQTLFNSLQPNVDWVPSSTATPAATGSATTGTSATTAPGATATASATP
jgi:hypothetical protein